MQGENRLFDDLARVASGALNALSGVKTETEALIRQQIEHLLGRRRRRRRLHHGRLARPPDRAEDRAAHLRCRQGRLLRDRRRRAAESRDDGRRSRDLLAGIRCWPRFRCTICLN